ncbi:MAG: hypothetical protein LBU25_02615, partial [Treponema sp.]|nr:hypothetical protein [Treponema sp.]
METAGVKQAAIYGREKRLHSINTGDNLIGKKTGQKLFYYYRKSIAVILFLILWETAPRLGLADSQFIPPISKILATFQAMIPEGKLPVHIFLSLRRSLLGFGAA